MAARPVALELSNGWDARQRSAQDPGPLPTRKHMNPRTLSEPLRSLCPQVTSASDRPTGRRLRDLSRGAQFLPKRTSCQIVKHSDTFSPTHLTCAGASVLPSLQRWHPHGPCSPLQTPCASAPTGPAWLAPAPSSAAPRLELSDSRPPPRGTPLLRCPLASADTPRSNLARARSGALRRYVTQWPGYTPPLHQFPPGTETQARRKRPGRRDGQTS